MPRGERRAGELSQQWIALSQRTSSLRSGMFVTGSPEGREKPRRVWEVLHPQGTRSRLPTTHTTSKDIAATGRTRGETANTRSTATLGQRHAACPTASTDLTNHSPPRELQPGISPASLADEMEHTGHPGLGSHEGCGH